MEALAISFVGGKEKNAIEILRKNAKEVANVAKKFEEVVNAYFLDKDLQKAEALGRELSTIETKADHGRRDFINALYGGAFLPAFRGDLAWLAERLDRVADTAEGAMRVLILRERLFKALATVEKKSKSVKDWRKKFVDMAKLTVQTVETLRESVDAIGTNIDVAIRKAKDVDNFEHQVDILEGGLLHELYELEDLFPPLSVIQMAEFIRRFGNISDRAEDMSDSIQILALTLFT
ncbi:MAG: TIGR00153 family protein [Candidatus Hadarchaeota archaeon]